MEGDDNFVMNISIGSNTKDNKMTFMSQNEKRKNKKEKFMERRMLTNKRRRENNANKKLKPFIETKKMNNINKVIENNTDIPIDENKQETNLDNKIPKEEQNQQEKKQKPKLTQKQKNEQQLHRDQLTEEIKNEIYNLSTIKKKENENKTINQNDKNNNQTVFSAKTFSDLKINEYLKKALLKNGYDTMTKIQKKSIPILLEHKNVVVKSETGSGKTLAYVIPLYEFLINLNNEAKINRKDGVHCIIFSPTHELCLQIEETFNKLKSSCINVVYGSLMGGQKVELEKKKLRKGLNVIISTPGRMLHHLKNTQNINFNPLKVIIFDEADLLLSMGFEKDIKECFTRILQKDENYNKQEEEPELNPDMFKKFKIFLISATIDNKIRQLTNYLMKGFKAVGFEQKSKKEQKEEDEKEEQEIIHAASGLNQFYSFISDEFRLINLIAFIYNNVNSKMIIFVSTCDCVNFLAKLLTEIEIDPLYEIEAAKGAKGQDKSIKEKNMKMKLIPQTVYKLHGKMKHDERKMIFNQFNTNKKAILISTDVAARGLDFPLIDWVIHYDVNPDIKEYVNRMGRTARLDHIGNSLIFLMQNEQVLLDTCLLSVKPKMKEIVSSDILLEFVNKVNKNILKNPIELKPMPFSQEVDENEKFRKKYIFAVAPIQRIIKDFIFADKENLALARHAFKSEVRSYVTFYKYQKDVFKVKALNLTRISRSFGLYKESMKMKVGNGEVVVVDHEYERTNVKAERKYKNKKIQNKLMYSEFE